jgi:phosphohistidine swiveling domain-containing protein
MKKIKINLDRQGLPSEYIQQRQDFDSISNQTTNIKASISKKVWFFSVLGFAIVLFLVIDALSAPKALKKEKTTSRLSSAESTERKSRASSVTIQDVEPEKVVSEKTAMEVPGELNVTTEIPVEKKEYTPEASIVSRKNGVPTIGGIHSGSIKKASFLGSVKMESGVEGEITSFMVGYYNGTTEVLEFVSGNALSEKLKNEIVTYNMNEMVFFTEILSETSDGKQLVLPSINLKIIP